MESIHSPLATLSPSKTRRSSEFGSATSNVSGSGHGGDAGDVSKVRSSSCEPSESTLSQITTRNCQDCNDTATVTAQLELPSHGPQGRLQVALDTSEAHGASITGTESEHQRQGDNAIGGANDAQLSQDGGSEPACPSRLPSCNGQPRSVSGAWPTLSSSSPPSRPSESKAISNHHDSAVETPSRRRQCPRLPTISPTRHFHVLFVDDEAVNRNVAKRMLQRLGCTTMELCDGDEVEAALVHTGQLPVPLALPLAVPLAVSGTSFGAGPGLASCPSPVLQIQDVAGADSDTSQVPNANGCPF